MPRPMIITVELGIIGDCSIKLLSPLTFLDFFWVTKNRPVGGSFELY